MAQEDRPASSALIIEAALKQRVHEFDFFHALRRLECAHPELPRLGLSKRPVEDPLRLGQEPSLTFATSTLASFEPAEEGRPARLNSYFFGLLGPNGPLPLRFTEDIIARRLNPELGAEARLALARFLDIFHHRMLSLFYRARAINRNH